MLGYHVENKEFSFAAILFTVALCMLFGASAVAIKISLSGLGIFTAVALRFSAASVVIFGWARITGQPLSLTGKQAGQLLIFSGVFVIQLLLLYVGVSKTHASRGTLLINLQPFFVLFLAHFFIPGDPVTIRKIIGIILGFAGVVFVFLEGEGITADFRTGDMLIIFGSFIWSCNVIYMKRIISGFEPFQVVLYPMALSVPIFFSGALLWDSPMIGRLDPDILLSLLYQCFIASFGFVAWTSLLQKHGAVSLHSFLFVTPISGVLLGGLLLGEPLTARILAALVMIVSGIIVVHFKAKSCS